MSALPLTSRDALDGAQTPVLEPCVLLKLGEIVLKGKNRQQFERLLHDNIRRAVRDIGVQIWQREGVIVLRVAQARGAPVVAGPVVGGPVVGGTAEAAADLLAERMRNVMGVIRICRAVRVAKDPEAAAAAAPRCSSRLTSLRCSCSPRGCRDRAGCRSA